jgi:hypothetical protein
LSLVVMSSVVNPLLVCEPLRTWITLTGLLVALSVARVPAHAATQGKTVNTSQSRHGLSAYMLSCAIQISRTGWPWPGMPQIERQGAGAGLPLA